jgi:signal peptidase II
MSRVYAIILSIGAFIIALDQWTKNYALEHLPREGASIDFLSWWNWTLVHNHGAAFGMLRDLPDSIRVTFFIIMPLTVLTVLWFAFVRHFKPHMTLGPVAMGLVLGGALGNLIDRIRFGYVIDFVDWFYKGDGSCLPLFFRMPGNECHWPVFNVADSSILIAFSLMIWDSIKNPDHSQKSTDKK